MKRGSLSMVVLGLLAATMAAAPIAAEAQYRGGGDRPMVGYDGGGVDRGDGGRRVGYDGGDGDRGDGDRGYGPRGGDRRMRCRDDGSGGALIGAIAGGLLGNAVAGYGDRAAGTILGGVGGAFAGRAIDRDC